jgi:hypothetical protein
MLFNIGINLEIESVIKDTTVRECRWRKNTIKSVKPTRQL